MMKIYSTLLLLCFPTIVFSQDLIKMGYEPIYEDGLNERKRVVLLIAHSAFAGRVLLSKDLEELQVDQKIYAGELERLVKS